VTVIILCYCIGFYFYVRQDFPDLPNDKWT